MRHKFLIALGAAILILAGYSLAYACGGGCGCGARKEEGQRSKENSKAIEVGNKVCPVMGGKIVERRAVKFEHEGKMYNLCCAGCIGEFKNDPKKYIEKIKGNTQESPKEDYCSDVQSCHG